MVSSDLITNSVLGLRLTVVGLMPHLGLHRLHGGFGPAIHVQRLEDVAYVVLHRLLGDAKLIGNFLVAKALGDELEDLLLTIAKDE